MFAEELGGNANRRRQEEARAKRRQLKKEQLKKTQKEEQAKRSTQQISQPPSLTATSASASAATPEASSVIRTTAEGAAATTIDKTNNGLSTTSLNSALGSDVLRATEDNNEISSSMKTNESKPSAVANALQQRQLRQQAQNQQKAAVNIQSFYRAHRSNCKLLQHHSSLLAQRLQDISTLRNLLKEKTNAEYIPPPATSTFMIRQILFITRPFPYNRKVQQEDDDKERGTNVKIRDFISDPPKVRQIMQFLVLPGLLTSDQILNPFETWLQSDEGKYRLKALLRLSFVTATMPQVDPQVLNSIATFLLAVSALQPQGQDQAQTKIQLAITEQCRSLLFPSTRRPLPETAASTLAVSAKTFRITRPPRYLQTQICSNLDAIQILRFHLLFNTGGPNPIPTDSERLREACIPEKERKQADSLFLFVVTAIKSTNEENERRDLFIRFFSEILTIPLLTWKISAASLSKLLEPFSDRGTTKMILLMSMLKYFVDQHSAKLELGELGEILFGDSNLAVCPATPAQSLLANLILIGRMSPSLNGSDPRELDYNSSTLFFQFVASLVDAVPLGTFSSRESVVEWMLDEKGVHSPVVLSPVVMEQCRLLLVDAFVRKLFHCAINEEALKTDHILSTKNANDLKEEKELANSGQSATSLAAKEIRVDRSHTLGGWARRMKKGVSNLLSSTGGGGSSNSNPATAPSRKSGVGKLMDTSAVSRSLALNKVGSASKSCSQTKAPSPASDKDFQSSFSPKLLISICRVYGILLARWGGGGNEDIIKRFHGDGLQSSKRKGADREKAASKPDPFTRTLLNVLCFSTSLIRAVWGLCQQPDSQIVLDLISATDARKGDVPVRCWTNLPSYSDKRFEKRRQKQFGNDGVTLLYMFVSALSHVLIITDDAEIHEMGRPLPLHQLRRSIQMMKQMLYRACCIDDSKTATSLTEDDAKSGSRTNNILQSNYFGLALISATSRTMRDLYDRSSRRPFCLPKLWLVEGLMESEVRRCKTHGNYVALLSSPVLRVCPFLVSFKRRLKIFERIVTTSRVELQGENSQNPFHTNPLKPGIPVRIARGRVLEDGLVALNNLGPRMRQRIAVQYVNEVGARESGVDAGGLFKEFWTDLSAIAFDPNYALFRVTEGAGNCMYPSPSSGSAHGMDHIVLFEFLGRILGKALYEGITIRPQFAHFFLSFLRGDYNFFHMLPDLSTMDPQLHDNLMFLKTYDGDAEDLCLTFTVANDDFGSNTEIPLLPHGSNIPVTNTNKQQYIGLVAKYYVVDRVKDQSEAFTRGLWEVIDRSWLRLFNEPELQIVISGATDGKIDVDDMRSNVRYIGGYTGIDLNINRFWNVMKSFDSKQQADLLRFVTSCERPPPLGFSSMNPPFTIQRVGILRDGDKLPTASTCFNTLKLPTYSSEKVLRDRLLYAIQAGAGFELT